MEFIASYCYGPTERYNAGRGLHCLGLTEADANRIFQTFMHRDENYALEIRHNDVVIRKHGPSMAQATASMNAAYRRRMEETK